MTNPSIPDAFREVIRQLGPAGGPERVAQETSLNYERLLRIMSDKAEPDAGEAQELLSACDGYTTTGPMNNSVPHVGIAKETRGEWNPKTGKRTDVLVYPALAPAVEALRRALAA